MFARAVWQDAPHGRKILGRRLLVSPTGSAGGWRRSAMSRTVHHVPERHRYRAVDGDGYWSRHQISDLRYSQLVLLEAERRGRRPCPGESVRIRRFYKWPRATNDHGYEYHRRVSARWRRHQDRAALRHATGQLDAVARRDGSAAAIDEAVDRAPLLTRALRDAQWWVC